MTVMPRLLVKRLSENAKIPTRGSAAAAGYDLYRYQTSQRKKKQAFLISFNTEFPN